MTMYICIAMMPVMVAAFFGDINRSVTVKKKYCIITGILLFSFLALRSRTLGSTDTTNYYNTMARAINSPSWASFFRPDLYEAGSQFFIWSLSRVFKDPQWLIVVTSGIYVVSIMFCLWNNSKCIPLALMMYICLGMMSFQMQGMRQALAMSICLLAYESAKKRKLIPFVLLVFLAMQFHRTAIVFLPVYLLSGLKFNWKSIACVMIGCIAILLISTRVVSIANNLFERDYNNTVSSGGFVALAIYMIIIIIVPWLTKRTMLESQEVGAFYILLIGATCYMMSYFGAQAAERISFYFMFSQCIILPNVIVDGRLNSKSRVIALYIDFFLIVALNMYRLQGSDMVPYLWFWSV